MVYANAYHYYDLSEVKRVEQAYSPVNRTTRCAVNLSLMRSYLIDKSKLTVTHELDLSTLRRCCSSKGYKHCGHHLYQLVHCHKTYNYLNKV